MSGIYAFFRFQLSVVSLMPRWIVSEMDWMRDSKMAVMASNSSLVRFVSGLKGPCAASGFLWRSVRSLC